VPSAVSRRRQGGLALIYGLFMLATGFVMLFFLFNTGQLSSEKTRLVNTADAVAYSAGVMHARALNFDAYTNRALIANEVLVAQTVSIASWVAYAQGHVDDVPPMNCYEVVYSVPFWLGLAEYLPLCTALSWPPGALAVQQAKLVVDAAAPVVVVASEAAKVNLQLAQTTMFATLLPMRTRLMREVADANYINDGVVDIDELPLTDNFTAFDGAPFISLNKGDDRGRLRDVASTAAKLDAFVKQRSWSSHSPWPCLLAPRGDAVRSGGTDMAGLDDWQASDQASLNVESWHVSLFSIGCKSDNNYALGSGSQSARDLGYRGVPAFYELSSKAQAYGPDNADPDQRDARLRFAIRLTRANGQTMTSEGRSAIKPSGKMAIYDGKQAGGVMAAVATSEVYFERLQKRDDGKTELGSLFNPYWQVHLVGNSAAVVAAALALQVDGAP
jgi:hypothetical protein